MKAIILAGGKGTRLAPYTKILPKPLMPIGDMPILEVLLRQMKCADINEAIITVGHLAGLLRAFFQDGSKLGLKIRYSLEDRPLGTAGPLFLIVGPCPATRSPDGVEAEPEPGLVNGGVACHPSLDDLVFAGLLSDRRCSPADGYLFGTGPSAAILSECGQERGGRDRSMDGQGSEEVCVRVAFDELGQGLVDSLDPLVQFADHPDAMTDFDGGKR